MHHQAHQLTVAMMIESILYIVQEEPRLKQSSNVLSRNSWWVIWKPEFLSKREQDEFGGVIGVDDAI